MSVVVLTNTGGRPEAFDLCVEHMRRQCYTGEVTWIVAHDVDMPELAATQAMPSNWRVVPVRAPWTWRVGQNTQAQLLALGIRRAKASGAGELPLLIVEDDDYYPPQYLRRMTDAMRRVDAAFGVVGYARACYYNVGVLMYREMRNMHHASLCESGVIGRAVDEFLGICDARAKQRGNNGFIDIELWARANARHRGAHLMSGRPGTRPIGMKGLPGRAGIGSVHRVSGIWRPDPDGDWLRSHIGDEIASRYRRFAEVAHGRKPH